MHKEGKEILSFEFFGTKMLYMLLVVYCNGVEGWEQVVCETSPEELFSKRVYVEWIDRGFWSLQYTTGHNR